MCKRTAFGGMLQDIVELTSYENPAPPNHESRTIIVRVSHRFTRTVMRNHQTTVAQ
jgi:hypothetical protein